MKKDPETLIAIDIKYEVSRPVGTAYFRITPQFRDFLKLCEEKHGILGFEYTQGELNFGVILKKE